MAKPVLRTAASTAMNEKPGAFYDPNREVLTWGSKKVKSMPWQYTEGPNVSVIYVLGALGFVSVDP